MSDFADVTEKGILAVLEHSIHLLRLLSGLINHPSAIVVQEQEIHRKDCFNKRKEETQMEYSVLLRRHEKKHFDTLLVLIFAVT